MAAYSRKPPSPLAKPLLKRGVTIQLDDGSTIFLNRELASKFDLIRNLLDGALSDIEREERRERKRQEERRRKGEKVEEIEEKKDPYDVLLPVKEYSAEYIRKYLELFAKIEKREKLPNVRLTELFDFFLLALYMGNDSSVAMVADYIFSTILANQSASEETKKAIREMYSTFPFQGKNLLMNQFAEINRTLSLKNVRELNVRLLSEFEIETQTTDIVAIDNQGRIILLYEDEGQTYLYDETSPQRQEMINSMLERASRILKIGGIVEQEIAIIDETRAGTPDPHLWQLVRYLPDQAKGQVITDIRYGIRWYISGFGSKLLMAMGEGVIRVYDLVSQFLVFQHKISKEDIGGIRILQQFFVFGYLGKYLLIGNNLSASRGIVIELFAVGEKLLKEYNRPFIQILIPSHKATMTTIDPYRELIYITDLESSRINLPGGTGYSIDIILVLDFSGQVQHRYVYPVGDTVEFYPTARYLLTHEKEVGGAATAGDELVFGIPKDEIQYIDPAISYSKIGHLTPVKLPDYEAWPRQPAINYRIDSEGSTYSDNLWIRDANDNFKVKALVKANTEFEEFEDLVTSSANGDYIMTVRRDVGEKDELAVIQTVPYTNDEMKIIREILEGEKNKKPVMARKHIETKTNCKMIKVGQAEICEDCLADYKLGQMLGEGTFSTTFQACKGGNCQIALKIILDIPNLDDEEDQFFNTLDKEVAIHRELAALALAPELYDYWTCTTKYIQRGRSLGRLPIAVQALEKYDMDIEGYFKLNSQLYGNNVEKYIQEINPAISSLISRFHQLGYVHGDLNSGNILIKLDKGRIDKIALTDFSTTFRRDEVSEERLNNLLVHNNLSAANKTKEEKLAILIAGEEGPIWQTSLRRQTSRVWHYF